MGLVHSWCIEPPGGVELFFQDCILSAVTDLFDLQVGWRERTGYFIHNGSHRNRWITSGVDHANLEEVSRILLQRKLDMGHVLVGPQGQKVHLDLGHLPQ